MKNKQERVKKLMERLKILEESSTGGEISSVTEKLIDDELKSIKESLKKDLSGNPTVRSLEMINGKLAKMREEFDLKPIIASIDELQNEVSESQKSMVADFESKVRAIKESINDLSSDASRKGEVSTVAVNLDNLRNEFTKRIKENNEESERGQQVISDINKKIDSVLKESKEFTSDQTAEEKKERTKFIDKKMEELRTELMTLVGKITKGGGGNMNRQIRVDGDDVLTKYTDINLVAGDNVTLTAADDNTNKRVNITFDSSTLDIGDTITGGTEGSVLFVGPSSTLAQDNTNFFWDDTANQLNIGNNTIVNGEATAPLVVAGDSVTFLQANIQNTNTGVSAYTDITASADNDNPGLEGHYIDMGIAGSGLVPDETGNVRTVTVNAAGTLYVVGDVLTLDAGDDNCTVTVEEVDAGGEIIAVSVTTNGSGYTVANGIATTGGTGSGATINVTALYDNSMDTPGGGYVYVSGGNLALGSDTAAKVIKFHIGGFAGTNEIMRVVDTSGGRLGIMTTSPSTTLHVVGTTRIETASGGGILQLHSGNPTIINNSDLGLLQFRAADGANGIGAEIRGEGDGTWTTGNTAGKIIFATTTSGAGSVSEKMRLTNAGNLGIGTISPAGLLHVASNTVNLGMTIFSQHDASADGYDLSFRKSRGTNASPTVITTGDSFGNILFRGYGGAAGYITGASIQAKSSGTIADSRVPGELSFWTGTNAAPSVLTERMTIDNAGKIFVARNSGGVGELNLGGGGGISLLVGSDTTGNTLTNSTDKFSRIGSAHYTNSEEPLALIFGSVTSSNSTVNIGGGTSSMNAARQIVFFTAANNTTVTGTEVMRINFNNRVGIMTTAPDKVLEVNLGTADALRLTYDDSSGSAATYMDTTVSSVGLTTFTAAGSAPSFSFAQNVTSPYFIRSVGNGLTAAGSTRADALQLAKEVNNVTTAAASTGVILPVGVIGMRITIFNNGANPIQVYASASETIDTVAGSTGVPLTNAKRCDYFFTAANTWISAQLGVVSA